MSTRKKNHKPKKINLLTLSAAKKVCVLQKVKESLKLQRLEAEFWQSLLEVEKLTINGYTIDFENGNLNGLTTGELSSL